MEAGQAARAEEKAGHAPRGGGTVGELGVRGKGLARVIVTTGRPRVEVGPS